MFLKSKLSNWQREGFIAEQQALQIEEYERSKTARISFNILLYAFAGFMFASAIISLVAYNWEMLGSLPKIIGMFALLITSATISSYLV